MQSPTPDLALAHKMLLPLAQKMMEKAHTDKKLIDIEELKLYLFVLRLQDKHKDQIAVIEEDKSTPLSSHHT